MDRIPDKHANCSDVTPMNNCRHRCNHLVMWLFLSKLLLFFIRKSLVLTDKKLSNMNRTRNFLGSNKTGAAFCSESTQNWKVLDVNDKSVCHTHTHTHNVHTQTLWSKMTGQKKVWTAALRENQGGRLSTVLFLQRRESCKLGKMTLPFLPSLRALRLLRVLWRY